MRFKIFKFTERFDSHVTWSGRVPVAIVFQWRGASYSCTWFCDCFDSSGKYVGRRGAVSASV